jgi:GNAT superfamily N-acetyltransferase
MPIPTAITIDDICRADENPFETLGAHLRDYNNTFTPDTGWKPLWLFARDANGRVQGGLDGRTSWGWCYVDRLAVAPEARRQGVGSRLLAEAESVARRRGCLGILLTTTTFQAQPFYAKNGFREFGRLADYPPGHEMIWLAKRF